MFECERDFSQVPVLPLGVCVGTEGALPPDACNGGPKAICTFILTEILHIVCKSPDKHLVFFAVTFLI